MAWTQVNGEPDQQAIIIDDCYDIHIRVDGNTDIINALTFKERTKVQITENIADDFEDEFILQTGPMKMSQIELPIMIPFIFRLFF